MKKSFLAALTILMAGMATPANAFDLKDLLGGNTGETLGNIIEGVFTKTDLEVKDLAGTWQSTGSAVTFKSDNFLQKAGGIAGAAAIETKLDPYFERYGLIGSEMAISPEGEMTLKIKRMTLKGTITQGEEKGTFNFEFKAFGAMKLTSLTAYVEKSPQSLNVMFDATKLKQFISVVANISGMTLAKTVSSVLDSYEGACIGFKMKNIGPAPEGTTTTATPTNTQKADSSKQQENKGADLLRELLGGKKK